jgi:hypothetical protein
MLTALLLSIIATTALAQEPAQRKGKNFPSSTLTTELGIGLPLLQIVTPQRDWILSNQTQYNINRKLSLVSHTALTLYASTFRDTKDYLSTAHSFSLTERLGLGTTFYTRGTANGFFLLGGLKYSSVKSTMNHPDFPEETVSYSSLVPEYGLMYNVKVGRKKYFFSGRLYVPLNNLPLELAESVSIELGAGMRLIP